MLSVALYLDIVVVLNPTRQRPLLHLFFFWRACGLAPPYCRSAQRRMSHPTDAALTHLLRHPTDRHHPLLWECNSTNCLDRGCFCVADLCTSAAYQWCLDVGMSSRASWRFKLERGGVMLFTCSVTLMLYASARLPDIISASSSTTPCSSILRTS